MRRPLKISLFAAGLVLALGASACTGTATITGAETAVVARSITPVPDPSATGAPHPTIPPTQTAAPAPAPTSSPAPTPAPTIPAVIEVPAEPTPVTPDVPAPPEPASRTQVAQPESGEAGAPEVWLDPQVVLQDFASLLDERDWYDVGGAPELITQSAPANEPTLGCAALDDYEAVDPEYASVGTWSSASPTQSIFLFVVAESFADTETASRSLELLEEAVDQCVGVALGVGGASSLTYLASPLELVDVPVRSVGQTLLYSGDPEPQWTAHLQHRSLMMLVFVGVSESPTPDERAVFDELVASAAEALLAQDDLVQEVIPQAATAPEPAPPGTGHAPTESQWLVVIDAIDPSTFDRVSPSEVVEHLEDAFGDNLGVSEFTAIEQDCLAVQFASLERSGDLNSAIIPIYTRWCAPALFADRWAAIEPDEYNQYSRRVIRLDSLDGRLCFTHVMVSVATNGTPVVGAWFTADAMDPPPDRRYVIESRLLSECGMTAADAVRAGLTPTEPLDPSPALAPYCRAWRSLGSRPAPAGATEAEALLDRYRFLNDHFGDVQAPSQIKAEWAARLTYLRATVDLLETEELALAAFDQHPANVQLLAELEHPVALATIVEFNRVNCLDS